MTNVSVKLNMAYSLAPLIFSCTGGLGPQAISAWPLCSLLNGTRPIA